MIENSHDTKENVHKKLSPILISNQEQLKTIDSEPFKLSSSYNNNNNNNNNNSNSTGSSKNTSQKSSPKLKEYNFLNSKEKEEDDNKGSDELLEISSIQGYKKEKKKEILYWMSVILTCGIALLIYHWFQIFYINSRYKKTQLIAAELLLIYSKDQKFEVCKVEDHPSPFIIYRFSKFFYNSETDTFEKSKIQNEFDKNKLLELIDKGLKTEEVTQLKESFSENVIKIPLKSIPRLLMEEVLHPFFIFQIYSVCLWFAEEYYYYAIAIFIIASVSAILNLREIRHNLISLERISYFSCPVEVLRNGIFEIVSSIDLVPGDIVKMKQSTTLPCDFILLTGQSVIVNEAMLTGESIPVSKYPILSQKDILDKELIPDESSSSSLSSIIYKFHQEKRSLLFGGTVIVKVTGDSNILGMVRETAFQTTKGKLILSILYPKKSHFKFISESMKFIGVLCCIALIGFAISVWRLYTLGEDGKTIVLRALDLITIVIPPALPMAMTVGTGFALVRLKKNKIYCISPPRLNMAGKIQVFCFDKTGTLTEEGLDLYSLLLTTEDGGSGDENNTLSVFQPIFKAPLINDEMCFNVHQKNGVMKMLMSSCHSLSNINNEISGDPLEIKIFQVTNSKVIDESSTNNYIDYNGGNIDSKKICYIERFDFQSKLQRMSVIVNVDNNNEEECFSFIKGSPESIKQLSLKESIPLDYDMKLKEFTEKGYRVLSCAYKPWDMSLSIQHKNNRDEIRSLSERDVRFLGFIIMENKMKPESPEIINTLQKANIKTVMVTGDNPLTALSVAQQTGIISKKETLIFMGSIQDDGGDHHQNQIIWENVSHRDTGDYHRLDPNTLLLDSEEFNDYNLVITGPVFKKLYNGYLQCGSNKFTNMLRRGIVYARMTPDEKQLLIEELERIGLYVGMCGDGANDCGALKAAHVGISLSESEASIAAPFTSTITNVSCCPTLIKEGRASLAVSFKLFQFMGMYSLIQFTTVIYLYFQSSVLGNWMYLYQDLWVIFPLVIFMGMTRPSNKLSIKRPSGRLISGAIVGSLIVHILVCIGFQTIVFFLVQSKQSSWPVFIHEEDEDGIFIYTTTSLFIYGCFQYLIMALTFSHGKPFLKPLYTNRFLFIAYLIALTTTLLLLFLPTHGVWEFAQLLKLPISFRLIMLALIGGNLVANFLVEFAFYYYKTMKKKKKIQNPTIIFSKDIPIDSRIQNELSVLLPIS